MISSIQKQAVASNLKANLQDNKRFDCKLSRAQVPVWNYFKTQKGPLSSQMTMTSSNRSTKAVVHSRGSYNVEMNFPALK